MKNIVHAVKHDFQMAILPITFFFVVFNLLVVTKALILSNPVTLTDVAAATIGALIVAKAVVIAEKLPFINLFSSRPLIFGVLWKTAIYGILCLVFRFVEQMMPLLSTHEGFAAAIKHLVGGISWPLFWALQIWLTVALIFYNSVTGLDKRFGAGSVRKAFLG
jgi:hypothetical protein